MPEFYNIKVDGKSARINIHSQIGNNWFGEGTSSQQFIDEVEELGEDIENIDVHISSPGGNIIDGLAIYNYLKQHPANVETYNDSMAGSIASVIFLAGKERHAPVGTEVFVHDPLTWVMGNSKAMREMADKLDEKKESIVDIYVAETGLSRDEVSELMTGETTLSAKEAVDKGFATKLVEYDNPPMNNINMSDVRDAVMMSAEIVMKDREILELKDKNKALRKENTALKKQPEPAASDEVIAQCKEAGFENLAVGFMEAKMPMEQIKNSLQHAGDVRDICAAVGIDGAEVVMNINNPVEMLRQAMNLQAALHGDDVSNHISPEALASGSGKLPSVGDIYAKRKQQTIN